MTKIISKKLTLSLTLLALICSNIPTPTAHAASVYDTAYQHTNTVSTYANKYGHTCEEVDLTNTWSSYIANNPTLSSSFTEAIGNGSWAVSQRTYNGEQYIAVFWTETDDLELDFNHLFSSYYETRLKTSDNSNSIHFAYIRTNVAGFTTADPCDIVVINNGTVSDYQFTTNMTMQEAGLVDKGFVFNGTVNDDPDYAGPYPSSGYTPQLVTGNALCEDPHDVLSAVRIDYSNGFDSDVQLTNAANTSKDYTFRMWSEGPYRVIVTCDGIPHYGPIIEDNPLTLINELHGGSNGNYNWVCVEDQNQPYCYAS